VTAQELDRGLSRNLERFFGSGCDDGLAQLETGHAGLLLLGESEVAFVFLLYV